MVWIDRALAAYDDTDEMDLVPRIPLAEPEGDFVPETPGLFRNYPRIHFAAAPSPAGVVSPLIISPIQVGPGQNSPAVFPRRIDFDLS